MLQRKILRFIKLTSIILTVIKISVHMLLDCDDYYIGVSRNRFTAKADGLRTILRHCPFINLCMVRGKFYPRE